MSTTDLTAPSITCPKCQAANAASARFCFTCGAALQPAAMNGGGYQPAVPAPPPFPPPLPPPAPNTGVLGGASNGAQATLPVDAAAAFAAALQAVQSVGGTVKQQQAPYLVRFDVTKKGFWSTGGMRLRFDGELALAPQGARQTAARVALKLVPTSRNTMIGMYAATTLVLLVVWGGFGVIFGAAGLAFAWHKYSNTMPSEFAESIANAMLAPTGVPNGVPNAAPPAPMPPAAVQARAEEAAAATVVEQLRQLGQLRDLGVVTAEEFEAKKAELLRRI